MTRVFFHHLAFVERDIDERLPSVSVEDPASEARLRAELLDVGSASLPPIERTYVVLHRRTYAFRDVGRVVHAYVRSGVDPERCMDALAHEERLRRTWLRVIAARSAMRRGLKIHRPPSDGGSHDHCVHGTWGAEPCARCDAAHLNDGLVARLTLALAGTA